MADITDSDVKIYKSANQTDTDDGGGRMSSDVIVSGVVNNLFPNISRIDRLNGRIQLKKVYQKIDSANTAVYSGAHLIIRDIPLDENVSLLLFPTDDHNDHLPDIVSEIEDYYHATVPAGNAGLEYAVDIGGRQLVFKIRHYEYTPKYDKDGKLVYLKKIDAKYALNITVGELCILDNGANTEYIHIQQMERVTETLDDSDDKHYYIVEYVIVTISAGLLNAFDAGVVPQRTAKNNSWQCFGAALLSEAATEGDTDIVLASAKSRLAPVIERNIEISDQAFFGPPTMVNDVSVGADGIEWTIEQAEQINVSESEPAISGKTSYTHVLESKPLEESTLEIWYRSNLGWYVITESEGTLSGDGSGSVSSDGIVTFTLNQPADQDTHILFYYSRGHSLAEHTDVDLVSPDIVYNQAQFAIAAETDTATGTIEAAPVQAGYVKLYIDEGQGAGFVEFGTDSGAGVITGDNIEAGTIDYFTGEWSITLNSPYTHGIVLKFEFIPLTFHAQNESQSLETNLIGQTSGAASFSLSHSPVQADSIAIVIKELGWTWQSIPLSDDGSGNLSGSSDDGEATGSINYKTGYCLVSFTFNHSISRRYPPSIEANYYSYSDVVFSQESLPYKFTIDRGDALADSLLIKYYTEEVDQPWYARSVGGVLQLQASMEGWAAGTVFSDLTSSTNFQKPYFINGQWVLSSCAAPDLSTGAQFKLFVSIQGMEWTSFTHDIPSESKMLHFAAKESGPVYVAVGGARGATESNVFVSNNLSNWTGQVVGVDGEDVFTGVVYVPSLDMFIAMTAEKVFTSADEGATWTEQTSQISVDISAIIYADFGNGDVILIFGSDNKVQYSTDGVNWTLKQSYLTGTTVGAAMINANGQITVFAINSAGAVSKTIDGENFELLDAGLNGTPTSLASDGVFNLVAALDDGTIDISNDYGKIWNNQAMDAIDGAVGYYAAFGGERWLYLSFTSDDAMAATLPCNIMTDGQGDPIKTVGMFDPDTGTGEINAGDLPVSAQARYFLTPRRVSDFVVFSWGATPIRENTFTAFGRTYTGAWLMLSENPEALGTLTGDGSGTIDKESGVAILSFSFPVRPESLRLSYNYGLIYKPEYEEINTRGLPLDGLVPVVQGGDTAVLVEMARSRLTAGISDVELAIDVENGSIFPDREITVKIDDEEITGTMTGNTFSVAGRGANSTTAASHDENAVMELISRREEMLPILQVAGNRVVTPNPLAYDYKAGGALLTTAIVKGDTFARETDHHTQVSWDGSTWEDSEDYTGDPADGTYNFTDYPLELTNQGATTERWLLEVVSLSPLKVDIRGEYLGVIATDQDTSSDIAPNNPNTGAPYFTIKAVGWGAGWQVGNILRFNTVMAGGPAWACRVINARASDIQDDYGTLQSRGDVAV